MGPFFHKFHPKFFFKCSLFKEKSLKMGTFQNDPSKTRVRGSSSSPPIKKKSEYPQQSMSFLRLKVQSQKVYGWDGSMAVQIAWGVLKFGFGRDVQLEIWKWMHTCTYQFSKKKWPIHIPIGLILDTFWSKILQNWLKFGKKFEKLTHLYTKFYILSQWAWFSLLTRGFIGSDQNSAHPLL